MGHPRVLQRLSELTQQDLATPVLAAANRFLRRVLERAGPLRLGDCTVETTILHLVEPPTTSQVADHLHPDFEVTCVRRGHFVWTCRGREIACGPGDLLLMPAHLPHRWRSTDGGHLLGAMLQVRGGGLHPDALLAACAAMQNRLSADPLLDATLGRLESEARNPSGRGSGLAALLLHQAVGLIVDHLLAMGSAPAEADRSRAIAETACASFRSRLDENPGVADIAAALDISARHLNRCCQQAFGRTASEAFRRERVDLARRLLLDADLPVGEIGQICGFANASHFSRIFRATSGVTPQQYRAQARIRD